MQAANSEDLIALSSMMGIAPADWLTKEKLLSWGFREPKPAGERLYLSLNPPAKIPGIYHIRVMLEPDGITWKSTIISSEIAEMRDVRLMTVEDMRSVFRLLSVPWPSDWGSRAPVERCTAGELADYLHAEGI